MSEVTRWPGLDDKAIVAAMLHDPQSEHWTRCREYVNKLITAYCPDLTPQGREDALQETMASVYSALPSFRFGSRLTTWLTAITRSRIIDLQRKQMALRRWETYPIDALNGHESNDGQEDREDDAEDFTRGGETVSAAEEECLIAEQLREAVTAMERFVQTHANPGRNREILRLVLFEGYSFEEAAAKLAVSPPVIGYVVRAARKQIREYLRRE